MKRVSILLLVFFGCFVLTASPQTQPQLGYKVVEFKAPGAGVAAYQGTFGNCINDAGQAIGYYLDSNYMGHGFVRFPNGSITTFDVQNSTGTFPWGNNSTGWITGTQVDAQGVSHGFLRDPDGNITTFSAPDAGTGQGQGTYGAAVNAAGEVLGGYADSKGVGHSFVRSPGGKITEFDPHGAGIGSAHDSQPDFCQGITPLGEVAGAYHDAQGVLHPFVRAPNGKFTTFDIPGSAPPGAYPSAINAEGAMTGAYFTPAVGVSNSAPYNGYVRAPNGTTIRFDVPAAQNTAGSGINAWGQVVGIYWDNSATHGFIRYPTGWLTKFDCPDSGTGAGQGTSLNYNSATGIVGTCTDQNNVTYGLLLLPYGAR